MSSTRLDRQQKSRLAPATGAGSTLPGARRSRGGRREFSLWRLASAPRGVLVSPVRTSQSVAEKQDRGELFENATICGEPCTCRNAGLPFAGAVARATHLPAGFQATWRVLPAGAQLTQRAQGTKLTAIAVKCRDVIARRSSRFHDDILAVHAVAAEKCLVGPRFSRCGHPRYYQRR